MPKQAYFYGIDDSLRIAIDKLAEWGYLNYTRIFAQITWGKNSIRVGIETRRDQRGFIALCYRASDQDIDETLDLQLQRGKWFFRCHCTRLVTALYKPPNSRYFRCRTCHHLIYQSSRESSKGKAWARRFLRDATLEDLQRFDMKALSFRKQWQLIDAMDIFSDRERRYSPDARDVYLARISQKRTQIARTRWRNHKRREQRRAARIARYWQAKQG